MEKDREYINNLFPCDDIFEYHIEPSNDILNKKYDILLFNQNDCSINVFQLLGFFNTVKSNILRLICQGLNILYISKMFILKYKYNFDIKNPTNFKGFSEIINKVNNNKIVICLSYERIERINHIFIIYKNNENKLFVFDPQYCGITKFDDYFNYITPTDNTIFYVMYKSKKIMDDYIINDFLLNENIKYYKQGKQNDIVNIKKYIKNHFIPSMQKTFKLTNIGYDDYILINNNNILDLLYIIGVINNKQKNILRLLCKNCLIDKTTVEKILLIYDKYNNKFSDNVDINTVIRDYINLNDVILGVIYCEYKFTFFLIYKNIDNKLYVFFDKNIIPYDKKIFDNEKYIFNILITSSTNIKHLFLINYLLLI